MKLFRKIDTTTGNFIEDVLFESHPIVMDAEGNTILDAQFVEEAPQHGFYLPRWNGTEWIEGGQAPQPAEPEPQAPTMDQMAIALMQTQAELEEAQTALDFLLIGGI